MVKRPLMLFYEPGIHQQFNQLSCGENITRAHGLASPAPSCSSVFSISPLYISQIPSLQFLPAPVALLLVERVERATTLILVRLL